MTPRSFTGLAVAALVCLVTAVFVYSTSVPWSRGAPTGAVLFESLQGSAPEIARIKIQQGTNELTLERTGTDWLLKQHQDFPASTDKVRTFLVSLSEAELVEPKTRMRDRYALLELRDPAGKSTKGRLVRLFDKDGNVVAETIVGKNRINAFGSGKTGTYVRKPDDEQTWLVNTEISTGIDLKNWVDPRLFEARRKDIKRLSIRVPGEEEMVIELASDGSEHLLKDIPDGMKVGDVNAVDNIAEAASKLDFNRVRRLEESPAGDNVSTVALDLANGLEATFTIQREEGRAWVSVEATGEGDAKADADRLMGRARGWQFEIPGSKASDILKKRKDILEKVAS